ncbi:MAG: hypothetical protein R2765_00485 [Ferruginibacter sp.]
MAGNVGMVQAPKPAEAGADAVKVGIGPALLYHKDYLQVQVYLKLLP